MKQILKAIRPLKNRMHANAVIKCFMYGFITAGVISIALSCVSLFSPVAFLTFKLICIYSASFLVVLLVSLFLRPENQKVIKKADSFGTKERLVTAYELRNETSTIAVIQRTDAFNAVMKMDLKALFPIRFPFEHTLIGLLLVFFLAGTFFIPSPSRESLIRYPMVKRF